MMLACMAAVGVAAWILAQSDTLGIGGRKLFQQPFEIVFIVAVTGLGLLDNKLNWIVTRTKEMCIRDSNRRLRYCKYDELRI